MTQNKTPNAITQAAMLEARQSATDSDRYSKSENESIPILQLTSARVKDEDFIFETFKLALKEYVEWAWGWDDALQRKALLTSAPIHEFQIICFAQQPAGGLLLQIREQDLYLRTIFIHPDYQRQGIGKLVLRAI
jgi:GNAT superfamily N-acetyltransferase